MQERTLSIIKPDGVARNVVGQVVATLEKAGLRVIAMRMLHLSPEEGGRFYAVHAARPFYNDLKTFISSGPIVAMVLEGEGAIAKNREVMGATNPKDAKPGTIRAQFAESIERNTVHGSDSPESAAIEIPFFFDGLSIHPGLMERQDLFDLTPQRLAQLLAPVDARAFTARQVLRWAYNRAADDFAQMTDVSKAAREFLASGFTLTPLAEVEALPLEGVVKTLHRLRDGHLIESVLIPEEDHNTLCVSSQAGCAMGCAYCETARGGLDRDLTTGEILAQVAAGVRRVGDRLRLRNLVFMGMGEPLANLDAVLPALSRILAPDGFDFSPRRVTVSTCGVAPGIGRLGRAHPGVNLAVSLNAADDETRARLMPVARAYPLKALMGAVRRFPLTERQRVTFAYVLLEGVNDSDRDARLLAALVRGIPCKINLIPYNKTSGGFRRPTAERAEGFLQVLLGTGLTVTVREGRGEEIGAACGQLRGNRAAPVDAAAGTDDGEGGVHA